MICDVIQTKLKMYNYISSVMQYMINNYLVNDQKIFSDSRPSVLELVSTQIISNTNSFSVLSKTELLYHFAGVTEVVFQNDIII